MAREAVLNREIMIEARNGRFRFFDWNFVGTSVGGCWEPVYKGLHSTGKEIDFDDAINRIDKVGTGIDFRDPYLRDPDSNQILIGGILLTGRSLAFDNN